MHVPMSTQKDSKKRLFSSAQGCPLSAHVHRCQSRNLRRFDLLGLLADQVRQPGDLTQVTYSILKLIPEVDV